MMHIQRLYAVVADAECKGDRTAPAYKRMARWKDSGLWESFLVHGDSPPPPFLGHYLSPFLKTPRLDRQAFPFFHEAGTSIPSRRRVSST